MGSVATYAGRRLTVNRVIIHPKYDTKTFESDINDLKEVITDWEINDRERTQEFFDKYNKYNKLWEENWIHSVVRGISDIALLKVKNRIYPVFNDSHYIVNSICLPKSHIINGRNESIVFIGMGVAGPTERPSIRLKKGNKFKIEF